MRRPASRTLLSNLAFLSASRVSAVAMNLVITSHLARALGAAGFGTNNFAVAYISYFAMIVGVGYEAYLTREIAFRPERMRSLVASAVVVRLLLASVMAILAVASLLVLHLSQCGDLVLLIQTSVLFGVAINVTSVYQGLQRMHFTAAREVLGALCNMIGVLVFVHAPADLPMAAGITAGTFVLTNLMIFWQYASEFGFPSLRWPRRFDLIAAHRSLPFFWAGLMITINLNTHLIMLGLLRNATDVGLFSAGWKLFTFAITVPTLISSLFLPRFAQVSNQRAERMQLARLFIEMILFLMTPLVMLSIALMPQIVLTLFGAGYLGSLHVLALLMLNSLMSSASIAFVTPMLAGTRQNDVALFGAISVGAGVTLDLLLIPLLGIEGAALAALATAVVDLGLCVAKRPELSLGVFISVGGRCLLAVVPAALLARLVASSISVTASPLISLIAGGTAGAVVYIAALWPMRLSVLRLAQGLVRMQ
jgi:polysaccharide transporter, PST family